MVRRVGGGGGGVGKEDLWQANQVMFAAFSSGIHTDLDTLTHCL